MSHGQCSLVSQLRIVFAELNASEVLSGSAAVVQTTANTLQNYGRRYAAEMYLAAQVQLSLPEMHAGFASSRERLPYF